MSVITTYTCDRCGAQQATTEQFWTVGVCYAAYSSPITRTIYKSIHACRACVEEMGLVPTIRTGKQPAPPPTIEDLIRGIIQAEFSGYE